MMKIEREDYGAKGRFVIYQGNLKAGEMTYTWAGESRIIIDHTGVQDTYKGKGFGEKLVYAGVDFAREER
ncbi:MAG: N-acetyltransferase [Brumimicrobium sp.]|nr:N-acetyltransferase [Brumimicrobium sp.]